MSSNTIPAFLAKHAEWIYRTLLLLGVVAVLWLNSRYVTRDEFNLVQNDVSEIKVTLRLMAEQNKVNDRQDEILRDIEQRLRVVEKK